MELELDEGLALVDLQLGLGDGIVHPVVDIKLGGVLVAHPAAAHVGLIRQNQGGGQGAHRGAGALVVVADGCDHLGNLRRVHVHVVQQAECHDGSALRVVNAVDQVADVVEEGGNLHQLHFPGGIAQGLQNVLAVGSHQPHMGKAVLGKAQGDEGLVCLLDIGPDPRILLNLLKCNQTITPSEMLRLWSCRFPVHCPGPAVRCGIVPRA